MPEVTAKLKYLRISPKKVRPLARLIKGMEISEAEAQLRHYHKKASLSLIKLLKSAVANAQHNFHLPKSGLYIRKITVDPGPSLKRWMPRAQGRVSPILKRTSHVTVVLGTKAEPLK
ncbi:MAG: 50S ribosomal protein L22 [Candidatus Paceibacteria bacterium]